MKKEVFGEVEEITSRALGAERTNVAKVTLWGPDFLHHHKKSRRDVYLFRRRRRTLS